MPYRPTTGADGYRATEQAEVKGNEAQQSVSPLPATRCHPGEAFGYVQGTSTPAQSYPRHST